MNDRDAFENQDIQHLKLFLYLLPVFGFFPALWTLYRQKGTRQERSLSRLVIRLALGWFVAYFLLGVGVNTSDSPELPLLIVGSLLTSGYFLVNIWLMVRLWQRKAIGFRSSRTGSPKLPRMGRFP